MEIAVVVFKMRGCPACASYVPRFQKIADTYPRNFLIYVVDADQRSREAEQYRIQAVPTTLILKRGVDRPVRRVEGDISNLEIKGLLDTALRLS